MTDYGHHHSELQFESGERSLYPIQFTVHERISRPFDVVVHARAQNNHLDPEAFVGRAAAFRATTAAGDMAWTGICETFEQTHATATDDLSSTYFVRIVPSFWRLTQRRGHRIFQHLSTKEIVCALLDEWGVEHELSLRDEYPKHEYRVQYGESDFAFVTRLLEEAGIAYAFKLEGGSGGEKSTLCLLDRVFGDAGSFEWVESPSEAARKPFVTNLHVGHTTRPGAFLVRDFDFRRPERNLKGEAPKAPAPEGTWEQYHYSPGGFLIDTGPGDGATLADRKSVARHRDDEGVKLATRRLQAERSVRRFVTFETNVLELRPGAQFGADNHPRSDVTGHKLLITESQTLGNATGEFRLLGTAAYADGAFRVPLETPKPRIDGIQSATVVGPTTGSAREQELHVDELGRVRVRFHWDREGQYDDDRTCWLRVSQGWAGAGFGAVKHPRVGDEVLVEFFDGDPDQPLVVGRLYKQEDPFPYLLPKNKTRSTWKTQTSPFAEKSFNELMFEDALQSELVFLQAQRNLMKLVKHDETRRVGEERLDVVGDHRLSVVARVDAVHVGKQHLVQIVDASELQVLELEQPKTSPRGTFYEVVDKRISITTGQATIELDGGDIVIDADSAVRISAKGDLVIEGSLVFLNCAASTTTAPSVSKPVDDKVRKPEDRTRAAILKLLKIPETPRRKPGETAREFRKRVLAESGKVCDARDRKIQKAIDAHEGPVVVDRVIIGAGLSAVSNYHTLPDKGSTTGGIPSVLAISSAPDPWPGREEVMGQTAQALSNSQGFATQPRDFVDDPNAFCPSDAFGAAVADTRARSGMGVYKSGVKSITQVDSPAKYKIELSNGKTVYANNVDITSGPGPARKLSDPGRNKERSRIISAHEEAALVKEGLITYGDRQLSQPPLPAGKKVLVYGGGASAAWNYNHGGSKGADVAWAARGDADPTRDPFKGAKLARNAKVIEATEGRRRVAEIRKVERTPDGRVKVFFKGKKEGEVFDQVCVSTGQNASSKGPPPGVQHLLKNVTGPDKNGDPRHLATIEGIDPRTGGPDGNIVGLHTGDEKGGIRVLGAAASAGELKGNFPPGEQRALGENLTQRYHGNMVNQINSSDSHGVPPGIEVWEDSYPTANGAPALTRTSSGTPMTLNARG